MWKILAVIVNVIIYKPMVSLGELKCSRGSWLAPSWDEWTSDGRGPPSSVVSTESH